MDDPRDAAVYAVMLIMAVPFAVVFGTALLLTAPIWLPVVAYEKWRARQGR